VMVVGTLLHAVTRPLPLPGVGPSAHLGEIPPDILAMLPRAAAACPGLPWPLLAAIAKIESDFTPTAVGPLIERFAGTEDAHALGMMQFLPSTYRGYAAPVDGLTGKGLGMAGIWDAESSLFAAALYLCDSGAPGDMRRALFAYNNAQWYVDEVLAMAARYGYLPPGQAPIGVGGVIAVASAFLGWPYVWGGDDPEDGGFDCSGLMQYAFAQVGVALPRTAQAQFDAVAPVADPAALLPGDLVFFADTYPSVERITHVGLYLGDGLMINAPVEGQPIAIMPVFEGFWGAHFAGGGRVGGLPASGSIPCVAPLPLVDAEANLTLPPGVAPIALAAFGGTPYPITQGWGPSSLPGEPPYLGYDDFHAGIDFGAPLGTPVFAPTDGYATPRVGNSGNLIVDLDLGNGHAFTFMHLSQQLADGPVRRGDPIGLVGSTGYSTGPHLHLELRAADGAWIAPEQWPCLFR
jgi:murein DD-endopeptidase MepM/ murein hydrolase activator NlpD